jgi:hypothetical protein
MPETERPFALCHCGTPLVGTFEMPGAEWYCVGCEKFFGWLHATDGGAENPTAALAERYALAKAQYDAERAARRAAVAPQSSGGAQ